MLTFKSYASGSSGNLYSISDGKTNLLIECGLPIAKIKKLLNYNLHGCSACLASHEHLDHCKAAPDIARAGIDLWLLPETKKALSLNGHRVHEIELFKTFNIGTFRIKAFPLQHDVPICGFLFQGECGEKAVFITDSFYVKYVFNGLSIIALGVNYSKKTLNPDLNSTRKKRLFKSHMSLETALKFFKANDLSRVREIHLLHLSSENGDPDYFKSEVQKATGKPVYIANP